MSFMVFPKKFSARNIGLCLALTVAGLLLLTWYINDHSSGTGLWVRQDIRIFLFFNEKLVPGTAFFNLVSVANTRFFDVVTFLIMGALYFYYYRQADKPGKRYLICVGLAMLVTAVLIKQADGLMPMSRPSPTIILPGANLLSQLSDLPVKDMSGDSFPSDHGMMLMVFAAFAGRYFGSRAFLAGALIVVFLSLPRIMGGAHWFGDIYGGSLGLALVVLPWVLLTPLSDAMASGICRLVPRKIFEWLRIA